MNPKKPTTTSWGGVAEWYDDLLEQNPDSYQKNVLMPNLIRIIDPKPGMKVLDVACGQGYFSRAFAQNGATVVASDISAELIEKAKNYRGKTEEGKIPSTSVEYYVAPADNLSFMGNESVDVVTIILALQNIENLPGTCAEAARVLKPGGKLIFVVNHPAFRIPQRSDWGWQTKMEEGRPEGRSDGAKTERSKDVQYRRLDAYMSDAKIEIDMTPGERDAKKKKATVSFHRPLQVYFKHLSKSGFAVTRLEEWISHKKSQNGPRGAEEDRMRKEIPMFLCVEAKKV